MGRADVAGTLQAIMQLRRNAGIASLYGKETDEWAIVEFEVLTSAYFAGKGETISRCSVQLHSKIVESINRRHVATFNLDRLARSKLSVWFCISGSFSTFRT